MRSWNYVTLEQISGHVTSIGTPTPKPNYRWRQKINPVILVAAVVIGSAAVQIQPKVSGNDSLTTVPMVTVEASHRVRPAFLDAFAEYFEPSFVKERKGDLIDVARLGSSLDRVGESDGVTTAISAFDDREEWEPTLR